LAVFGLDEIAGIADFIARHLNLALPNAHS
jgi:hypothetical protein